MTVHNLARKLYFTGIATHAHENRLGPTRHLPTQTHFICNQTLKQLENLTFSEPTSQKLHLQSQTNNSNFFFFFFKKLTTTFAEVAGGADSPK